MVLRGDVCQVEVLSFRLEIVLMSALDGCTVCTECTMGMEIILGTPDATPRWLVSSGSLFGPFGDSVSLSARLVHGLRRKYNGH
jgi:hypothetical protein